VDASANWTGKPSSRKVIRLIVRTIELTRINEGEFNYLIPHSEFPELMLRSFDALGRAISEPFRGSLRIRFQRVLGRSNVVLRELRKYERVGIFKQLRIQRIFKKVEGIAAREFVFILTHVHPVIA